MAKSDNVAAIENLQKLKDLIPTLRYEDNFKQWQSITHEILEEAFGANSLKVSDFKEINYTPLFMSTYMSIDKMQELFARGLAQAEILLNEAITELGT